MSGLPVRPAALAAAVLLLALGPASGARAQRVGYADEQAFLDALDALGLAAVPEGFEDDAAWGEVRSTIAGGTWTAPSIHHLGIVWSANNPTSEVTTGPGPALSGSWGFYVLPHGSYLTGTDCHLPGNCGDGWIGEAAAPIHAVGGWIDTNTAGAKVALLLDGDEANPVDFPQECDPSGENCTNPAQLGLAPVFLGVIDPAGFTRFEYREVEGTSGDVKLLFADDFVLGFAAAECNDGLDNDGDGLRDFDGAGVGALDPQCTDAPWRDSEAVRSCGLGFELALLLPPLLALRRRRRTAA